MHSIVFLQDLAVVMIVAAAVSVVCRRFHQPVVLGYLVAGLIIGPHTPPFPLIHEEESIKTLADLGLIFLMFSLGLDFNLRKLRKVGMSALVAASLEIILMVWIGYEIGRRFGWKPMDCVFVGAMLSISSTTIIVKALRELGRTKEKFAELIFGILIIEDLLAIIMLAMLSSIAMTGSLSSGEVFQTVSRLGIFIVVSLVFGLLTVPRLLAWVGRFRSDEVLLVTVLGLCFGVSLLAVKLNYSVALGAFVIGAVIAETREIGRIEALTEPIRDMFTAVFFVAIGLMIDPALLVQYAFPIAMIVIAVLAGKIASCAFGTFVVGNDPRTSLRVGMGLAQIGEFSFIIASLGVTLRVTSDFLYPVAVTVSAITTLLTPYLIRSSDLLGDLIGRVVPRKFAGYLNLYTNWVGQWRGGSHASLTARLIRRWTWQMALNLTLVAGVFIAAAYLFRRQEGWWNWIPGGTLGMSIAAWVGCLLISLPMLVATYRKLQALGMLLGEMAAHRVGNEPRAAGIKAIISLTVPLVGFIGMGFLIFALSTTFLPSTLPLWIFLGLITALVTVISWRTLIRIYAKGQIALEETFAQADLPRPADVSSPVATLLRDAQIESIRLEANSEGAGKLIRELLLRTRTGASVVAIERSTGNVINPGPDEELFPGDNLLLLGSRDQLESARSLLLVAK